ncbi:transcriptional regulator SlyA [Mycobacterium heckeshornense]|uniref:MarR family winged helix-turn-helix transcriptional regulator n=1 Tax=Mycobacterium heckeshornense TaxID=110505 RepID=UPI001943CB63|nr:MarR family transcriptional regulator [Mycobacterium heckeshornense]BCQ10260.1 transcriptional regulator SlyA [Mycobacterium heckeshornense]
MVPPVGAEVDVYGLPLTALVARLSHRLVQELAATYARESVAAQPLDASLLILLAQGSARPTALAARLNISKQALNFVLDRLQRDGLVTRVRDPDDRRAKRIRLTPAGMAVAELTRATLTEVERRWRSIVGENWPQLRTYLADITKHPG